MQVPLYLRFDGKPFWYDLGRELGVDRTGAALALDICNADGMVSYSRTARHYSVPPRYRNGLWTYRRVIGAVDHLDREGLIHHDRRAPGIRGWQSAMQATDELRRIVRGITRGKVPVLSIPRELILLRDKSGNDPRGGELQFLVGIVWKSPCLDPFFPFPFCGFVGAFILGFRQTDMIDKMM